MTFSLLRICQRRVALTSDEMIRQTGLDREVLGLKVHQTLVLNLLSGRVRRGLRGDEIVFSKAMLEVYVDRLIAGYAEDYQHVSALLKRDTETWLALCAILEQRAAKLLRTHPEGTQKAADFAQEAAISIIKNLEGFYYDAPFQAWATVIVKNLVFKLHRSQDKLDRDEDILSLDAPVYGSSIEEGDRIPAPQHPGSDEHLDLMNFQRALAQLPLRDQEILLLYYFYQWKDAEIAALFQKTPGAILQARTRARERLLAILGRR